MKRLLLSLSLVVASTGVFAAYHSVEISSFGNHFSFTTTTDGITVTAVDAHGRGYEISHYPDGTYEGIDANGDAFYGDGNTGFYINNGSGRVCVGTGDDRKCS